MKRLGVFTVCFLLLLLLLPVGAALAADDQSSPARAALQDLARSSTVEPAVRLDERTRAIDWLTGSWAAAAPGRPVESSFRFLEANRAAFGIDSPRGEFVKLAVVADDQLAGWRDVYLRQRVHGVPVLHARLAFHYDGHGRLVAVNGDYLPSPHSIQTPRLTADQAAARAVAASATLPAADAAGDLAARTTGEPMALAEPPSARLVYFAPAAGGLRLAYEIGLTGADPTKAWTLVVDARSGAILERTSDVETYGRGIDLRGKKVRLNTTKVRGVWKLIDRSQYMRKHHSNHPYTKYEGCIEIRDARHVVDQTGEGVPKANYKPVADRNGDNFFNHGGRDPKKNQRAAVSLARQFATTYKALRKRVGRNSLDGKGMSVVGNVHLGLKYENAYWNGDNKMMFFGDNKDGEMPFPIALDVVAHEFGHGVSDYSVPGGGLQYMYPSGALSETFSDIWGTTVDYGDWVMGEDLGTPSRDLENPGAVADPLPATMFDYYLMVLPLDGGGNHYNCGVGGHFFQQLSAALPPVTPAADGRFTAVKIVYRSYAYIGPYASMRDWAFALRQAAVDLYGAGSAQDTATLGVLGNLGLSTIDFDQWDDGWCLDDANNLRGTWVGEAAGTMYVGVKFELPPGALLYRIYVAIDAGWLPLYDFNVYVNQVNASGGMSEYYVDYEYLSPYNVLSTGQFTPIQITDGSGSPTAFNPGSQFFLTIGYIHDDTMPVVLLDSGTSPQGRSYVLNQSPIDPYPWWSQTLQAAIGDPGNLMIRPMYYYPSGLSGRRAADGGAVASPDGPVRVIDGPIQGKSGVLATP